MRDFTSMTADQTVAALEAMPARRARPVIRRMIYKKSTRPEDLGEQLRLLQHFARSERLDRFERTYALIACAHKACEVLDLDTLAAIEPDLADAFDWARGLPQRNILRNDGFHMRYSLLNVQINSALLRDSPALPALCTMATDTLDDLVPRFASPYLFNSSTNVAKTVCLAVALGAGDAPRVHGQLRRMISLSLTFTHLHKVTEPLTRRFGLKRLDAYTPPSTYSEFEDTMKRLFLLEDLCQTPADTNLRRRLARACVIHRTEAQKAAMLAALERHL